MSEKAKLDPRTLRTRQLLLQAFFDLLPAKNFEALTIQDIADRATVNRATFYAHFQDKYALLNYAVEQRFEQALSSKLPPNSEFNATNLQLLIQTICEFLGELHSHCASSVRPQFDVLVEQQIKAQLYGFLLRWLQTSRTHKQQPDNAALRATIASWAIYGAAMQWTQSKRQGSAAEFARQVLPMILAGLESTIPLTTKTANTKHVARVAKN